MTRCEWRKDPRTFEECGEPATFVYHGISRDIPICTGCATSNRYAGGRIEPIKAEAVA